MTTPDTDFRIEVHVGLEADHEHLHGQWRCVVFFGRPQQKCVSASTNWDPMWNEDKQGLAISEARKAAQGLWHVRHREGAL